jgi:molybdate transport system substrate-binding protein
MHRRGFAVLPIVLALVPLTACGGGSEGDSTTITVLAASSLTGTFTELGKTFEQQHSGVTVKFAFDSSATLAQQATQGAPADVLATADQDTMKSAQSAQAGTPKLFASNVMVLATPAANPAHITAFSDLDKPGVKYVMCVTTAPCGSVGQALLDQNHITAKPASQQIDVKSVLAQLTEGEADAGLVYVTDAIAAGNGVKHLPIPGSSKQITYYPIVTLKQSKDAKLAQEFVDLVLSTTGQNLLRKAGFGAP